MSKLRPVERAYIAGLFDGEGCVHALKRGKGKPYLSIQQRDPEAIYWLQKTLGFGRLTTHRRPDRPSANPDRQVIYRLTFGSKEDVSEFISLVLKYSILKKKKLQEAKRWLERTPLYGNEVGNKSSKSG